MTSKVILDQKKYFIQNKKELKEIFTTQEYQIAELFYCKKKQKLAIARITKCTLIQVEHILIRLVSKIIMHRAGLFVKE